MPTAPVERESDPTKPCIVFFSEPEKRIALMLSASKILPENVFIVSELSWIKVLNKKEQTALYLLEGITMNEFGQCFYAKFKTPQKITFLCNFLTESKFSFSPPAYQQKAQQFQEYERLANCPISSGVELNEYTDDKLHTRLLAVAKKIAVPTTLAFSSSLEKYHHHPVNSQVQLIDSKNLSLAEIRAYLRDFPADKFVIKPSGARWMGGRFCTIESKDNLELAVANFQKCLDTISHNECLLVEEFIDSSFSDNSSTGARLRIFVTRRPNNTIETSGILCHLGDVAQSINGDTSESFSIDYLCDYIQLTKEQKNQLIERLNTLGKTVLESIIDYETQYLTHIPPNKQTDFIGLDVFLQHQQGQIELFLIEVNNHDCISTLQLYEVQHSPHRTAILDKWVETMLYRSYKYMLQDQNILMIGRGGEEQPKRVEWTNALGLNLILCESKPQPGTLSYRPQFLGIDLDDSQDNLEKALAIIQEVRRHQLTVNGIVSVEKKYLALATLVAIFLEKSANSYESVSLAQSKLLTQQKILIDEFNKLTFEARKFSYGVTVFAINCLKDIQSIPLNYYPLLIELEPDNSGFVPEIVPSQTRLLARFEELQTVLPTGIRLGLNYRLIATSYPNGTPQYVVLILSEGELIAGYLTPSFSTRKNLASERTEILPSFLDRERQENLIYASWKACYNLGLKEGIFYIQGVSTELGAKILDIQVCPWKTDLIQWLFKVWDINPVLYSSLIACGFKPFVNKNSRPRL
ncbi:MAG: hypothetical protein QNJ65_20470 [Xenococcaceae cyanobacterium MO_234.B1]|nr:hypothetical protein [Xenococcaceae cyanobacterium MO_234.B1]